MVHSLHDPGAFQRRAQNCRGAAIAAAVLSGIWLAATAVQADDKTGEAIYKLHCAACHGAKGEGVDDHYPQPLIGDRSLGELTAYIDESMPEDDPAKCVGEDAKKVAAFVYDSFYSPVAQARNRPARIELSRLTVRQYQNAVADLIGAFRDKGKWGNERGLRAEYSKSRRPGRDAQIERIDPTVQFDFGEASPDQDKLDDPSSFSIRWEGSVLAPETGEYEFIVRTEHAARLWVNDEEMLLIDAWVKSGTDTEFKASIRLLGGRAYPIQLDFSKAKQGVNDSKKRKKPPPPVKASIALLWKVPQRAVEVIPARCLSPEENPELFVVRTPFPPDDRSVGYERGTSISKEWDLATTEAAIATAGYVAEHLSELSDVDDDDDAAERIEGLKRFCQRFVERAFRRPLSGELKQLYIERQFEGDGDPAISVKKVVLLTLKSPRFLYRDLGEGNDPYDVASRISFGLWDSLPDETLLEAAKAGQLETPDDAAKQAERMLDDLRAKAKLRQFFLQWLKADQMPEISKDSERFPGFDEQIVSDLRTSLELMIEDVVFGEASDFRELLTADSLYLNGRLAKFYGADLPADAPFQKVALDAEQRAGILSHPYLMAGFAYTQTSSPIHRGVFIARSVLGRSLRPPPEAVSPLAPDLHASLTTRERVALQTKPAACQSCHAMVNPLGFTLEHFDAVGRFRREEQGNPIDASGLYRTRQGETVKFDGVHELATFLSETEETHTAFVEQLFHHLVKQPVRAFGGEKLTDLRQSFAQNQFHIRKLAVEIIASSAVPK